MNKRLATDRDKEIARRVWMRRNFRGLHQQDLAKIVGVSYQQIHKYENAMNRVPAGRLAQIAEALDTPIEYFFQPAPDEDRKAA